MTDLQQSDTLYISDLDGTLLQSDATLSPCARAQLTWLLNQGLPFTIATARTIYSVASILEGLPLRYPLILQNGAVLYDPVTQEYCHAAVIDEDAANLLFSCLKAHRLNGFVYCLENNTLRCCYTELTNDAMRRFYQERKNRYDKPFRQVKALHELTDNHVVYCSLRDEEHRLRPAAKELQNIPGIAISFYRDVYETDCWYLEIASDTATKYHGAMRLRAMFCKKHLVAFGDNDNDLPLFAACDTKIAVENATPALRVEADSIIEKNTDDAVVRYLLQYANHANTNESQDKGVLR